MNIIQTKNIEKRGSADVLVIPFWKGKTKPELACQIPPSLLNEISSPIESGDFKGKEGEIIVVYLNGTPEKRGILLGLGEKSKSSTEVFRRAFANVTKTANQKKWKTLNVFLPEDFLLDKSKMVRGLVEGLQLPNYSFFKLKNDSLKENSPGFVQKVTLLGEASAPLLKKSEVLMKGVNLARDLVNGNADDVNAPFLAEVAKDLQKEFPTLKVKILGKKEIEKEKMGLISAVNKGSANDPLLITAHYKGNPKSKDLTILIGKGVTYDTGGLNLKPTGSMETMKDDMAGAAVVLATLQVVLALKLKVNLSIVIPAVENCIDSRSYKPGDVYKSFSGKTVEIGNTDAEGRLILADAVSYAVKQFHPNRIVDIATLTGGVDVALGPEAAGLMANDDSLAEGLYKAGNETFERVWRLPIFEEYKEFLKSDIADIKNVGGRSASPITGALFIKEFVENTPWAHLDIASMAYYDKERRYHPKFATGYGVRLLVEWIEQELCK